MVKVFNNSKSSYKLEFEYHVQEVKQVTEKIFKLTLTPASNKYITFCAGQYVYVEVDSNYILPYSIASSPEQNEIELLILSGENDSNIQSFLQKFKIKLPIRISTACGNAYFRQTNNKLLALAGGIGIAPIKSIVDYLKSCKTSPKIALYHVVKRRFMLR